MLPVTTRNSCTQSLDRPSQMVPTAIEHLFEGVELDEEDDEFVLTGDMPGYDREETTVSWDEGVLYVSGEYQDERRNQRQTFHRSFRFPKTSIPARSAPSTRTASSRCTSPWRRSRSGARRSR